MCPHNRVLVQSARDDNVIRAITSLVPEAKNEEVLEALLQDKALREKGTDVPPVAFSFTVRMLARIKAVTMLFIIYYVTLPVSIAITVANVLWYRLQQLLGKAAPPVTHSPSKARGTAMVSGGNKTKSLHVCRHLHRAGWRVVLVDGDKNWSSCTRFSNCVAAFHATPVPNLDPIGYLKAIRDIAALEHVQLWVPVSIAQYSVYEALAAHLMPPGCRCCTLDAPTVAVLNDKIKFTKYAQKLGARVPAMFPITSPDQLLDLNSRPEVFGGKTFLLKSVAYAALSRADLFTLPCSQKDLVEYISTLEISPLKPWLLQQFLRGKEYASYSIVHEGKLVAHADNEAELSCLDYQHVGLPEITEWVESFCAKTNISGQICFDFMRDQSDGLLYSIECNPRTSTNLTSYYNHPTFASAYFEPEALLNPKTSHARGTPYGAAAAPAAVPLVPLPSSRPVYWLWNELGKLVLGQVRSISDLCALPSRLLKLGSRLYNGSDAVLDPLDPLPFLVLHYLQIPVQLVRIVWSGTPWIKVDLCSGKVVELGGD